VKLSKIKLTSYGRAQTGREYKEKSENKWDVINMIMKNGRRWGDFLMEGLGSKILLTFARL
jgi:hypothetical protein